MHSENKTNLWTDGYTNFYVRGGKITREHVIKKPPKDYDVAAMRRQLNKELENNAVKTR